MAFQAAPANNTNFANNQNMAQLIAGTGVTPAAGTWQAAPLPSSVNATITGYPIG
jgi:hypothetical protein